MMQNHSDGQKSWPTPQKHDIHSDYDFLAALAITLEVLNDQQFMDYTAAKNSATNKFYLTYSVFMPACTAAVVQYNYCHRNLQQKKNYS